MSSDAREQIRELFLQMSLLERGELLRELDDYVDPCYQRVNNDSIEQGDILEDCPVYRPPESLADDPTSSANFSWAERDLVIMSQSCDMVRNRRKIEDVLLCPVWKRSEFSIDHPLGSDNGMEEARRGNLPGFHVLAACTLTGFEREVRVVEFRRVYTLPIEFVQRRAEMVTERIQLLSPYREQLSQAFARFFMRVGLPVDVPPFRTNADEAKLVRSLRQLDDEALTRVLALVRAT